MERNADLALPGYVPGDCVQIRAVASRMWPKTRMIGQTYHSGIFGERVVAGNVACSPFGVIGASIDIANAETGHVL